MNNLSRMRLILILEAQAKWARRAITDSLVAFADALRKDRKFPPELRDEIVYLLSNETCELSLFSGKLRKQLRRSHYVHHDLEMAINDLEIIIAQISLVLPVNQLFLLK